MKQWRSVGRFEAKTEDGQRVEVFYDRQIVDASTLDGRDERLGIGRLRTTKGQTLKPLGGGKFQIIETGESLSSQAQEAQAFEANA
jgi:hypothetical protein